MMQRAWAKNIWYPLSWIGAGLYGLGVALRLWLYRLGLLTSKSLPLKVLSVGNLSVGGTGKTPHVALLAAYLKKRGIRVAVLSRGYQGTKMKIGAIISDGRSILGTVEEGGEEPFWLAQKLPGVPVVVGRDRYRSGLLCHQNWRTQWVVLDDGFQHLALKREINVLLWPGDQLYDRGELLPLGRLREPRAEMRRADLVLITHAEQLDIPERKALKDKIQSQGTTVPVFFSEHKPATLWRYPDKTVLALSWLAGKRLLAFCGLAEPDSLTFSIKQLGADPVKRIDFPDHYFYQEKDKRFLETLGRSLKVDFLLTTEKDALKLGEWLIDDFQILVLGIEVSIEDPAFWEWLDQKLGTRQET